MDETNVPDGGICIGIDVGGTFTDAVLASDRGVWRAKSPTTRDDLSLGVIEACQLAAIRAGFTLEQALPQVSRFGLGTTAVTNALAERKGRRIGLITTHGFEDSLPLAKGKRVLDQGWARIPEPIIPRRCIVGVRERIDRNGEVLITLDPEEAADAAEMLVTHEAIEAIAVSFLWSFRNAVHEKQAVAAIARRLPGLPAFSSAALNPIMREFERTTSAVLNAYVGGAYAGIDALQDRLAEKGLTVPLLLVNSSGGSMTTSEARRAPLSLAMSGPAAGVAASVAVAKDAGLRHAVACDMGGTSFDVSVIGDGGAARRTRGDLFGIWTATPQIDIASIGAGGGSIGWADARGMLRVGPQSAGAAPGPACYGRGGVEPTVTDALAVLGYLDPKSFLGGDMSLDLDAARRACKNVGTALGLDLHETAWGIRQLALDGMVKATRGVLNSRGLDPAQHALISYGGCGSLFTPEIARAVGARRVVVPELASVLCALGAATTDIQRERARSLGAAIPVDAHAIQGIADDLDTLVRKDLAADGVDPSICRLAFEADLRFARQSAEISIALPDGPITGNVLEAAAERFKAEYARRFGRGALILDAGLEFVTLRAIGIGKTTRASLAGTPRTPVAAGTPAKPVGERSVHLHRGKVPTQLPFHLGIALQPGHMITGPAIIDGADTTIWIPGDAFAIITSDGAIDIEIAA